MDIGQGKLTEGHLSANHLMQISNDGNVKAIK